MKTERHILALDVGTTGVKALVFNGDFQVLSRVYRPLKKYAPHDGWVEQDPRELLGMAREVLQSAVAESGAPPKTFFGMGITNQRETSILWDRENGEPLYPAIVWEDTRTAAECRTLDEQFGEKVRSNTGLPIDPYFSASKIQWILKNVPAVAAREKSNLLFGTVDSWLAWHMLDGHPHVTDCTNASRTLLFNIRTLAWDNGLANIFGIPQTILPRVLPSRSHFGVLRPDIIGWALPVRAMCGDQQASVFAAGMDTGATKVTYGTGTFITQILGPHFALHPPFFTTLAPCTPEPVYMLETKIGGTGARIQAVLDTPRQLHAALETLTKEVAFLLAQLPIKPTRVVVDGGITRAEELLALQEKAPSVLIEKQKIYDGTALGIAMLAAGA